MYTIAGEILEMRRNSVGRQFQLLRFFE